MHRIARDLRALGDPGRLRVLHLLAVAGELCVCEIQELLAISAPTASRALRFLEDTGWVERRREGRWAHYSLSDLPAERGELRDALVSWLEGTPEGARNRELVERMRAAGGLSCSPLPVATGSEETK